MFANVVNLKFCLVIFAYLFCQFSTYAFECGTSVHSEGFIIGGTFTNRGDYPWIAALVNINTQKFFCGGSLITNSHVVTAAHCVSTKGTQKILLPTDIAVLLGKHNLNLTVEKGAKTCYLDRINIHPDWRYHTDDYDADIAILTLQQPVKFSEYISPVCWPSRSDNDDVFRGTVIGWGMSENEEKQVEEIPKELTVDSVKNEVCFLEYFQFAIISSNRTFCAGVKNAGPCLGDSGGGLFVDKNSNWIIRGIVSSSFVERGKCDVTKYAVYTNVVKHSDWVRLILSETPITRLELDEIIEPNVNLDDDHHIVIDCSYDDSRNPIAIPVRTLYACFVQKFDLPQKNSIAHIHGKHRNYHSNQDVEEFHLEVKEEFPFIPMGIGKIFPNLALFFIGQCSLKSIQRQNFEGMSKVTSLFLGFNDLADLPKDGFYDLFKLEALFIDNNRLKSLHRDLLVKMPKLKVFVAHNNQIEYLDEDIFRRNSQLILINLLNNKLKTIGVHFKQLTALAVLNLKDNICINSEFKGETSIDELQDSIDKNCSNQKN